MSRYLTTIETESLVAHVSWQADESRDDCSHLISVDYGGGWLDVCDCHMRELLELLSLVDNYLKERKECASE